MNGSCCKPTSGNVYFIRAGGLVKIGYSENPTKRLLQLQTGNPKTLSIVATVANVDPAIERMYHHFFRRHHIRGEWFDINAIPVRNFIAAIQNGARPETAAAAAFYSGLAMPKSEKVPTPEGFGRLMGELRSIWRAGEWAQRRDELMARGGNYPMGVYALEKRHLTAKRI